MVKKVEIEGKTYYQCEICKFYYSEKNLAQKCEKFCKKHSACSTEITKYAVEPKKQNSKNKKGCC